MGSFLNKVDKTPTPMKNNQQHSDDKGRKLACQSIARCTGTLSGGGQSEFLLDVLAQT